MAAALATAFPAVAQCTVKGVTFTSYGSGCSGPFPNRVPGLSGSWPPNGCVVSLWLNPYLGCCNTYLGQQILVFGLAPTNIPLPGMGPGCALLATPTVIFPFSRSALVLSHGLPSGTALGSVYVQGVPQYYTTVNRRTSYSLSQGMKITLR